MASVGFYHLTRTAGVTALARLLARTLEAGKRAVIRAPDAAHAETLDERLWLEPEPFWLPHATERMGDAALQPIWITESDALAAGAPNGAQFLFLIDGAITAHAACFERVFDLFDGSLPAQVDAARGRWAGLRDAGHALSYWRETGRGWERSGGAEALPEPMPKS